MTTTNETETTELYEQLRDAVEGSAGAAFRSQQILAPAAGLENPVLRAAVYSDGLGDKKPGPIVNEVGGKRIAIIESYEARAHRILESIKGLQDEGIALPVLELYFELNNNGQPENLLLDSFSASHHVTDACWREALEPVGQEPFPRFLKTTGEPLDPKHVLHPADLLRLYPTALLTGYDPRSMILSAQANGETRASRRKKNAEQADQAKDAGEVQPTAAAQVESKKPNEGLQPTAAKPWGRLVQSSITAVIDGEFYRGSSLIRPWRTEGDIYVHEDGENWTSDKDQALKNKSGQPVAWGSKNEDDQQSATPGAPSQIGLDSVTPSKRKVPDVWAKEINLSSYLSISRLKQLRFCDIPTDDGPARDHAKAADSAARVLLASLGIAGIVLADDLLSPRADCDLVRASEHEKSLTREFVYHGQVVPVNLDRGSAIGLVQHAIAVLEDAQEKAGTRLWAPQTLKLVARKEFRTILQRIL